MKKEMLINVLQPEEIRIAIIEDGVLEELYVERTSRESYVGNIYKGRIVNIEPSIQAAFVDFGVGRNGFLHVSDVEPTYYRHLEEGRDRGRDRDRDRDRDRGRRSGGRRGGRPRPPEPEERPLPDIASLDEEEAVNVAEQVADVAEGVVPFEELNTDTRLAELPTLPDVPSLDLAAEPGEPPVDLQRESRNEAEPSEDDQGSKPIPEAASTDGDYVAPTIAEPGKEETVGSDKGSVEDEDEAATTTETASEDEEKETRGRPKRRGRGRGRGRGRSKRTAEPEEDSAAQSAKDETPAKDSQPAADKKSEAQPGPTPPGGDRPFPMSSAEHRTDDAKFVPLSDEDLSFSMASTAREARIEREEPEEPAPAPPPPPPPAVEQEPVAAAPPPETLDFLPDELPPLRPSSPPAELTEAYSYHESAELPDLPEDREQFVPREEPSFDRDLHEEALEPRPVHRIPEERFHEERFRDDRRGRGGSRGGPGRTGGRSGQGRSGFGRSSSGGRPGFGRPKPLIQDIFKRGQEVLVQVIKEGIGTKGPTLSTYISIAGRYLVLMPGLNRIGVSRKIDDEDARRRLREILYELDPPKGLGFIIRTAGLDRNKKELQRDLAYLSRLWQVVVRRIFKSKSPAEIYQESDMITRTIRDIFTSEIDTIWVDEKSAFEHAQEFLQVVMPRYASRIKHYNDSEPMFHKYGIESEMDRIQRRHVPLPAGGSIVIDQTEALVAIDVNSGNFRADNNAEETAYQMNLQAAKEIARQLRLRDLGGVIVNDFIDMREEKHRRGVERALREAVRRDRARTKILRISQFGIIEMTRQRIRPSLKRSIFQDCQHCHGTGQVKTVESMSIEVMRLLQLAAHRDLLYRIETRVHEDVAFYVLNRKRAEIARLEEYSGKQFFIQGRAGVSPEFMELTCFDSNNNEVKFVPYEEPVRLPRRRS